MLQKQVIVITGGAAGIGRALALECQSRGHIVYATDVQTEPLAELLQRGIRTLKLDVTSADDIAALMEALKGDGAAPDILINNAGFGAIAPLAEIPLARLRQQFETNVFSIVALCQAVVPGMAERRRGRIVNIGSVSGLVTTPFAGAYCASKAAVHALSDALRMELAPFGIDVITVQPGGIRSDFGTAAGLGVRPSVLYAAIAEGIVRRARVSQRGAMSAEDFAREMLDAVLQDKAPTVVRLGTYTTMLPLMRHYLPTRFIDRTLSRPFKLDRLRDEDKT